MKICKSRVTLIALKDYNRIVMNVFKSGFVVTIQNDGIR